MPDRPWKVAERNAARVLGGTRNRMSGSVDQLTAGDVVHKYLYVEVKYRKRFAVVSLVKKVVRAARKENKLPVLVLQQANSKSRYYVMPESALVNIVTALMQGREGTEG